jgi:alkylation response protein AidB-like acyl-CoA dehydrogenase
VTTLVPERRAHASDVLDELHAWLEEHWSPELTVREWWERLGLAGWAAPSLPEHAYGRGLSAGDAVRVLHGIREFGALGPPAGLGLLLAAPTIAAHGTQDQIDRYVRDIVTGRTMWCQLFSEPAAGSDLAGLRTRAVGDGAEWVVDGQKVWTSGAQVAELGMLLARTDPDAPKHQGITFFAFDMRQPGVEVRPLREMTGHAVFNEVFLSGARVGDDAVIGGVGNGWKVANTTLAHERAGLGAGGAGAAGAAVPGSLAGYLDRRAGDLAAARMVTGTGDLAPGSGVLIDLARARRLSADPVVRQGLARLYTMEEVARVMGLRARSAPVPGLPNIAKLSKSAMLRHTRELGLHILGPAGMLHAYDPAQRAVLDEVTGDARAGDVTEAALLAPGPSIYGGTDEIQRNLLGERALGLPREPGPDRDTPFRALPPNG